ncbi:MAG: aspartate aminotransferase family protein [Alphaproteobacteria bacterium]|nr:aspartate aminotransferase family protein [Alphaproteobacteria bacterium]
MRIERSRQLHERARAVMPGGNTRSSVFESPFPLYAASGSGAWLTDVDGNRFLDFTNNFTTLIHGHAFEPVNAAILRQLPFGASFGSPTELEIELAELLCERVSWFDHVRFTNTGSEAVMMAIRAARAFTGRPKIVKCEGAYHGNYDPVEVSFDPTPENWGSNRPSPVPYNSGTPASVLEQTVVVPFNDIAATKELLHEHAAEIACVLVDPMPARAGLVPAERAYLAFLREFTRANGMVLISDEVLNFRLSHGGAIGRFGIAADLCAFGKIIGGGLPIGAVAGKTEFMAVFDPSRGKPPVPQAGTFTANPLSMTAGIAAMRAMTPETFDRLNALGEAARQGLREAIRGAGVPGQVTGLGSLFQIKLNDRTLRSYRDQYPDAAERARLAKLVRMVRDKGVLISSTGLGALSTPMVQADIDRLVAIIGDACKEARA